MPPYSDDLYSALDDEALEIIGDTSPTQDGGQGSSVTRQSPWVDVNPNTGLADTDADYDAGDNEDPQLLSPTDGYFGTGTQESPSPVVPTSSNVPYVPNVLVEDPSLHRDSPDGKAKEAEQERLGQERPDAGDFSGSHQERYTSTIPRGGSSSTYTGTTTHQQHFAPSSDSGATYYAPSSSSRVPPSVTPTSYTTYSAQPSVYRGGGERYQFIPAEAPPAYTPSPTSPTGTQGLDDHRNYRTFSQPGDATVNMGRVDESQTLLAHPEPESMRDHVVNGSGGEASPTWRSRRLRRAPRHAKIRAFKMVLIAVVLLFLTGGFLSSVIDGTGGRVSPGRHNPHTRPYPPDMEYPEVDDGVTWDPSNFCAEAQIQRHTQLYDLDFGAKKELYLIQRIADDDNHRDWHGVHVQGDAIFRRTTPEHPDPQITVETTVTDDRLNVFITWDADTGTLNITVPRHLEWAQERPRACVNIKATVWVPENSDLSLLHADVVHLNVRLLDNLSLSIAKGTRLSSTIGTIVSAAGSSAAENEALFDQPSLPSSFNFNSRIIDVHTTSGDISGSWPLFDYLGLKSTSGDIHTAVVPQPADPDHFTKSAVLNITSLSGDVSFREPIHAAEAAFRIGQAFTSAKQRRLATRKAEELLPPRDYRVNVHTTSGDINGAAAFSSAAGFRSTSGTVSLELLPILDVGLVESIRDAGEVEVAGRKATLTTGSTSGDTDLKVLEPLWVDPSAVVIVGGENDGAGPEIGIVALREGPAKTRRGGYVNLNERTSSSSSSSANTDSDSLGNPNKDPTPLRYLSGTHTSTSATIKLRYPQSWEGDVALTSLTGVLRVSGDGLKVIKAGSDWPGVNKALLARKGEKGRGGKVEGKSTSGDVEFLIGEAN
ncbi:uncharacterized protein C8A04DRAFT_14553 [Dichotomopilus funicola]|uniref:Adhesin domain-containing protein n=1 Tax=Dichotomopilus funicola TaxID=1934379 RepID=A0AAN6ZKH5_9PEZI|nr:hypothetical protein C8A04DRAFT_14553 [Dichotomopilus funicola]